MWLSTSLKNWNVVSICTNPQDDFFFFLYFTNWSFFFLFRHYLNHDISFTSTKADPKDYICDCFMKWEALLLLNPTKVWMWTLISGLTVLDFVLVQLPPCSSNGELTVLIKLSVLKMSWFGVLLCLMFWFLALLCPFSVSCVLSSVIPLHYLTCCSTSPIPRLVVSVCSLCLHSCVFQFILWALCDIIVEVSSRVSSLLFWCVLDFDLNFPFGCTLF